MDLQLFSKYSMSASVRETPASPSEAPEGRVSAEPWQNASCNELLFTTNKVDGETRRQTMLRFSRGPGPEINETG